MTSSQMIEMVDGFELPRTAAYACIFLDTMAEANTFISILRGRGYKTTYYKTKELHEVRFSGGIKLTGNN